MINNRLSPEYVLLGFLYDHSSHGYELNKRLMDEFGYIWRVSQSQTYNILNRLVGQGFITATEVEQDKLPPRQLLRLTEPGIKRFNTWLNTPSRCSVHAIRVEFVTRLYFIQKYYPQKIPETIRIQLDEVGVGIKRLQDVRASLADDQTYNQLALELRLKLLSSIVDWLNNCLETFGAVNA